MKSTAMRLVSDKDPSTDLIELGADQRPFTASDWFVFLCLTLFLAFNCAAFVGPILLLGVSETKDVYWGEYTSVSLFWHALLALVSVTVVPVLVCIHGFALADMSDDIRRDRLALSTTDDTLIHASRNILGRARVRTHQLQGVPLVSSRSVVEDDMQVRQIIVTGQSANFALDLSWVTSDADLEAARAMLSAALRPSARTKVPGD